MKFYQTHVLSFLCICIIIFCTIYTSYKNIEQFQCHFQADAGLICPVSIKDETGEIKPYQDYNENIQKDVIKSLVIEWGDDYNHEFIMREWPSSDALYVMTNKSGEFVGCIAVDRKQWYPYISQLLIVPSQRKKGYAKKLLSVAEKYIKDMGFDTARLWCEEKLLDYYKKQGWQVDEFIEAKQTYLMSKKIS